ncbi:MAG: type II toxin-antitoxin system Phd/YefM family antitoxin [Bacteroidetes bacterium]|nr:MAG: type II toxin-antitoxin system Phd/YefM family antitoxin [Bacteroidota bacterium]
MNTVNIHEAKTHLSAILKRVESGEEILIAKSGHPIARISPLAPSSGKRQPGSAKGKLVVSEKFMAPLPLDLLKEFEQ